MNTLSLIVISSLIVIFAGVASYNFFKLTRIQSQFRLLWNGLAICTFLSGIIFAVITYLSSGSELDTVYQLLQYITLYFSFLLVCISYGIAKVYHYISEQSNAALSKEMVQKQKLQVILETLTDGVIVIDNEQKIQLTNPAAQSLTHHRKPKFGQNLDRFFKPYSEKTDKKDNSFINNALTQGREQNFLTDYYLKHNLGVTPIAGSVVPLKHKNTITGAIVIFRDISREKKISDAKSEFVSVVSHQLRTPLTGIKWFLQLVKKEKLSTKQTEFIGNALDSTERIIHLVNDLLNMSRIDNQEKFKVNPASVNLKDTICQILEANISQINNYNVKVINKIKRKVMLKADPDKIYEALHNVVSNAIKYSRGKVWLAVEQNKQECTIIIKDNGIGIPKSEQHKLFQKFFRAENAKSQKIEGTGLGLYIVKAIIDAHDGKIAYETEENKGTTFSITLPLSND